MRPERLGVQRHAILKKAANVGCNKRWLLVLQNLAPRKLGFSVLLNVDLSGVLPRCDSKKSLEAMREMALIYISGQERSRTL